ncbi:MAG TPA: NUDIX domain-containing protein [Clostridia bacterium]|nr:NUDIX domain-containing protein [Clostridia bacterium]
MIFEQVLGLDKISNTEKIINRVAIRAVIHKDKQLLMITNNKGDIKFPGGGLEPNESHEEAIKREVQEETGFIVSDVIERIGSVIERREDKFEENCIFEMISYYYRCKVTGEETEQSLDDYEAELEYKAKWINLDEAISINKVISKEKNRNPWVRRELFVLNQLTKCNRK